MAKSVRLYALSTCGWCKRTKRLLNSLNIDFQAWDVDLIEGE
jgi:glutaredoxin